MPEGDWTEIQPPVTIFDPRNVTTLRQAQLEGIHQGVVQAMAREFDVLITDKDVPKFANGVDQIVQAYRQAMSQVG